ncbi:MAG TPA: hypothetical protein VM510_17850 [Caulifigura sp.]|nr:hypothetical protein [Caulifigura sp.]
MNAGDVTTERDAAHVVVLGASNVTLGFPRIVAEVRRLFPGRVQMFAAHGHGRSYGTPSWAPFRVLPGLRACGLWDDFCRVHERSPETPVYALLTDIGNDLLFGKSPERIDEWLVECLGPLLAVGATTTIGRPPVHALQRLGRTRFRAARSFFFPKSPLTYERMLVDVPRLDELIVARATTVGATTFQPRPEWYGLDPIHVRRSKRPAAWREIVELWLPPDGRKGRSDVAIRRRHWLLRPAEKAVFGRKRIQQQPAFRWEDGGGIWLY